MVQTLWLHPTHLTGALEVKKTEVLGLPAYLVKRHVAASQGTTTIRKYLVAKDDRVYSFALIHAKDELFAGSMAADFEAMVQSVQWSPVQK